MVRGGFYPPRNQGCFVIYLNDPLGSGCQSGLLVEGDRCHNGGSSDRCHGSREGRRAGPRGGRGGEHGWGLRRRGYLPGVGRVLQGARSARSDWRAHWRGTLEGLTGGAPCRYVGLMRARTAGVAPGHKPSSVTHHDTPIGTMVTPSRASPVCYLLEELTWLAIGPTPNTLTTSNTGSLQTSKPHFYNNTHSRYLSCAEHAVSVGGLGGTHVTELSWHVDKWTIIGVGTEHPDGRPQPR